MLQKPREPKPSKGSSLRCNRALKVVLTSVSGFRQDFRIIVFPYTEALAQGASHSNFWHLLAVVLLLGPAASTKELGQEFLQVGLLIMMMTLMDGDGGCFPTVSAVAVVAAVLSLLV